MRVAGSLVIHLLWTLIRLLQPGGTRSVVAESLLIKHQLLIISRSKRRAPALRPSDRVIAGLLAALIRPARLVRSAIVLKPSTIMSFHRALVRRKYQLLFTPKRRGKPGPKGPSPELIAAICEMKRRNPSFGYQRIAQQLSLVLNMEIDKDVVRRVLARHFHPDPSDRGSSWLTFLGHSKDSLWSLDFFRCESLILKSHWVMVVMDQYTRRIVGIAVNAGSLDGPTICRMFGRVLSQAGITPKAISTDHDPLFEFHRWKANLRVLEIQEIKTVPHVPLSHPFDERIIGTIRREFLDHVPFWTSTDLQLKLNAFSDYYNEARTHRSLDGATPIPALGRRGRPQSIRWQQHCRGLYELPIAA
jgi:transposase InsO family protein